MKKLDKNSNPLMLVNNVEELPPELKREVMATISYIHLMTNVGKLFSIDMIKTAGEMTNTISDSEKES